MIRPVKFLAPFCAASMSSLLLLVASASAIAQNRQSVDNLSAAELERQFLSPPDDARIMMRWWWFGPAVTRSELEREMKLMKAGGIGGFEIQPVYPVALDDARAGIKTLPFLSEEFLDALRYTNHKARELGLRVDLTIGSGWPYGGPSVPVRHAAGRLRVERVKIAEGQQRIPLPPVSEGEKLLAIFTGDVSVSLSSLREFTDVRDGAVWLDQGVKPGTEVMFFISSHTGMMVKRPAVGSEGFVLDHYNRHAIDDYLKNTGDPMLKAFGDHPPYAVFCDSLEVFNSDWTEDFLEEFNKRRGYDLKPFLPALVADYGAENWRRNIRQDWGKTLTELLNERFLSPMREWALQRNTKFRIQGYGIPPATISSNAYAHISDGEGAQWKILRAARWASSANHLYGRNLTSSETWTWLHSPAFRATPLDVKAEADLHFLQGINQLIGHGWPYTAEGVEYPGWRFYAAGVFNEKNPWWIVMPDLSRYLQRVSFMMRQGQPANDVAFYLPNNDAWAGFVNGKVHYMIEALRECIGDDVIARTLEAGYNLDFFDDDGLKKIGKVEKGSLLLGENKYRVVILPNVERIPMATMRKLEEFVRSGGMVIATRRKPAISASENWNVAQDQEIQTIAQRMFEGANPPAHFVADENRELGSRLKSLLWPDVSLTPAVADIGFIHRRTSESEIYFLANSSNVTQKVKATFRLSGMQAEIWNPLTGEIKAAGQVSQSAEGITVPLELEAYGSRLIVFTRRHQSSQKSNAASNATASRINFDADWSVSFGEDKFPVRMPKFNSWHETEATRYYSGVAKYQTTFKLPDNTLQSGATVSLDFGEAQPITPAPLKNGIRAWLDAPVRDAAVVCLNDERVGSVWCPPYSIDVTKFLKPGINTLRIEVGNTAINHLAGRRLPDYKLLNLRYGLRFEPQDMNNLQPLPSGLLKDVQLVVTKRAQ
jgi:hypothetical protein